MNTSANPQLGFGITTKNTKGSVMETVLMMMTMMEIDVEAFKILVPSPPCAVVMEIFVEVAMESPRRQGSVVDACMMDGISLGSSLFYIGLGGSPTTPNTVLIT